MLYNFLELYPFPIIIFSFYVVENTEVRSKASHIEQVMIKMAQISTEHIWNQKF